MYTKEEREGILWEFHRSGPDVRSACRGLLPLFPNADDLYKWLRTGRAGELEAREVPDRLARMHCSHGGGSPAYADRITYGGGALPAGGGGRGAGSADTGRLAGQTAWRDWGRDLPEDPRERAGTAEARLAEALAASGALKAPGPGCLTNEEKRLAGQATRQASPAVRLADVCGTLSIPKNTHGDQAARLSRPDPKAALRARVRASFEASGGAYGSESATADIRSGAGEPVSWRGLAEGDMETPVVASEKVVRAAMAEERLVARKAAEVARRARHDSHRGELAERPADLPLREDGTHGSSAPAPGMLAVTDVTEFALDGFKAQLSPAIDCFDGWPVCRGLSRHPDKALVPGMLGDLVKAVSPTADRPLVAHGDGGAACMADGWAAACEEGHVTRSMSRKARSPDNARCEGFFGTLKSGFFDGRNWAGVTFEEFSRRLDAYIEWYRGGKVKKTLGWKAIRRHREELGYAV